MKPILLLSILLGLAGCQSPAGPVFVAVHVENKTTHAFDLWESRNYVGVLGPNGATCRVLLKGDSLFAADANVTITTHALQTSASWVIGYDVDSVISAHVCD